MVLWAGRFKKEVDEKSSSSPNEAVCSLYNVSGDVIPAFIIFPLYNLEMGVTPEKAPDEPTYITLTFKEGVPTALNGKEMDLYNVSGDVIPAFIIFPLYNFNFTSPLTVFCVSSTNAFNKNV